MRHNKFKHSRKQAGKGIFSRFHNLLKHNRLGELLVFSGVLTPAELRVALVKQRQDCDHLGRVLVRERLVSQQALRRALIQQRTLRCLAVIVTIMISFSMFGSKQARANPIKDIPQQIHLAGVANNAFGSMKTYPALFGTEEQASYNLDPFTKWTGMFERFETAMNDERGRKIIESWKKDLIPYQNLSLYDMAEKVNHLINSQRYIVDNRNWGKSDYWATPVEFFTRGGDCEDFAIAKYTSLRALGVPEERLRVAIVHDEVKDIPHAVLIVYTEKGAVMLDNQMEYPVMTSETNRYRPIFSINRQAWWLHTKPTTTIIASAR